MKGSVHFIFILLLAMLSLPACATSSQNSESAPPSLPPSLEANQHTSTAPSITRGLVGTHPPSMTPAPTREPEVTQLPSTTPAPTREPAVATIIIEPDICQYEGPATMPATNSITITWRIKTRGGSVYALTAFIADEQRSREDLISSMQGLDMHRPALSDGLTLVANTLGLSGENKNITFRMSSGSLHGLLYFSCWDAGSVYEVLGPIEIK